MLDLCGKTACLPIARAAHSAPGASRAACDRRLSEEFYGERAGGDRGRLRPRSDDALDAAPRGRQGPRRGGGAAGGRATLSGKALFGGRLRPRGECGTVAGAPMTSEPFSTPCVRKGRSPWRAAAMAAVIASLTLSSIPADACSCRPPTSPTAARDAADAVFEGRAVAAAAAKSAGPGLSAASMSIPFTVLRSWKGVDAGSQVTITTSGSTATCGYPFAAGETYLVYAWREKSGGLGTGLCSRTRKSTEAADDFAAFGAPGGGGTGSTPPATTPTGTASPTAPSVPTRDPSPAGNPNAAPGNTTITGSSDPAPTAGGPSGISVEPAGVAPPPSQPPSGGCAACAVNPGDPGRQVPELAALVGLAALVVRIAKRRR